MTYGERIRLYLRGWDDCERILMETLHCVPDEHLRSVVEHHWQRLVPAVDTEASNDPCSE